MPVRSAAQPAIAPLGPTRTTPGAQEQGPHAFQFAITTYGSGYLETEVMSRIATYILPSRVFSTHQPGSADDVDATFLLRLPHLMFSTAGPLDRRNAHVARAFSISSNAETARFRFAEGRIGRVVDLSVRRLHHLGVRRKREGRFEVNLRSFEIVTF